MRICFLVTPNTHDPRYGVGAPAGRSSRFPVLGMMYVAAYHQERSQDHITFLDAATSGLSYAALENELAASKPDVVAMSVHSHNLVDVAKAARLARRCCPNCRVVLGGHHATLYPRETACLDAVDFVISGDGESSFSKLMSSVRDSAPEVSLQMIPGLSWNHDGKGHITPTTAEEADLDNLPCPVTLRINPNHLKQLSTDSGDKAYIHSSRGCPHGCTFCAVRRIAYRCRSAANITDEMTKWSQFGVRRFLLLDDSFTAARARVFELCEQIGRQGLRVLFSLNARVDLVDPEMLMALRKAGCFRIYYGVESGVQRILDMLQKGTTLDQIEYAFACTRESGIQTYAYLMIGMPSETSQDIKDTIRFATSLRPDRAHISIFQPRPGTPLYASMLADGLLSRDFWREFAANPCESFRIPDWNAHVSLAELEQFRDWGERSIVGGVQTSLNSGL